MCICKCVACLNSSSCSDITGSFCLYSKDEKTNFNPDKEGNNNFKQNKYITKILGDTESDQVNGILRNVIIAVPLKYIQVF